MSGVHGFRAAGPASKGTRSSPLRVFRALFPCPVRAMLDVENHRSDCEVDRGRSCWPVERCPAASAERCRAAADTTAGGGFRGRPQGARQAVAAPEAAAADTGRIVFAGTGHRSLGQVTSRTETEDLLGGGPAHYDQDAFGRGEVLVFTSLRDEARPQVYVRGADGGVRRLTTGLDAAHPELSVDGRTVVFDSSEAGAGDGAQRDLWSVGVDGSGLRRLTDTPADETHPTLSPDGTRIAYASDGGPEPGTQIYERALSGGPVTCISDSAEGDASEPEWNPVNDDTHRSRIVYTLKTGQVAPRTPGTGCGSRTGRGPAGPC
ncbi:hypothetical protein NKH18_29870 [Streptomyces sp. M10(2022)]